MKRLLDIILALILLILGFPLLTFIAVFIFLEDGFPIFFRQTRPGYFEKPFTIIKFRTMKNDVNMNVSNDSKRITKLGKFLRKTSLDELPEIWNVLKGEMSFVGPRPLLLEYLDLYSKQQRIRHSVKPGITGWAQVNGRNNIDWDEKLALDIWYVENKGPFLDFKIMLLTILRVFQGTGVSKTGFATTDKFKGNEKS
jgi:sugar transferase EpsL